MKRLLLFTIGTLLCLIALPACAETVQPPTETATPTVAYIECDYCFESVPEEYAYRRYDSWNKNTPKTEAQKALFNAVYAAGMAGNELSIKEQNEIYDKAYQDALRNIICPKCVYGDYRALLEALKERPNAFSEDFMVVKATECVWCSSLAPDDLVDINGERLCIACVSDALQNDKVASAFDHYREYG